MKIGEKKRRRGREKDEERKVNHLHPLSLAVAKDQKEKCSSKTKKLKNAH